MKNIKYIILFIFIIILSGCDYKYASTTRTIRHSGFSVNSNNFLCDSIYYKDEILDGVKIFAGNYMITNNGYIYQVSLGKKYTNNYNCMKPDFNTKISAILDSSILKGNDGYYYYLNANGSNPFTVVTTNDEKYNLYNTLLKDSGVVKVSTVDSNGGIYYVLKNDGNIYKYNVVQDSNNKTNYYTNSVEIVYGSDKYGKIIDFNYNGSSVSTFVKTTDSIYRMRIENIDECSKYADVVCKYTFDKDEGLSSVYNDILAFDGSTLITNYGKVFNVSN